MTKELYKQAVYNQWANARLLNTLEANAEHLPLSILKIWNHIINAELVWMSRIKQQVSPVKVWEEYSLEKGKPLLASADAELLRVCADDTADPGKITAYTNTAGEYYETRLDDILRHVLFHGVYHRGQIAREMRVHGLEPVNTDYITFIREVGFQ